MRVLFADDDVIIRTLLAAVLTHLGHQSRSASDGGEAWELFQAGARMTDPFTTTTHND